jgi:hypothetical protein
MIRILQGVQPSPAAFSFAQRTAILHRLEIIRPVPKRQGTVALQNLQRVPTVVCQGTVPSLAKLPTLCLVPGMP